MALRLLRRLCSVLHQQRTREKQTHLTRTFNRAFDDRAVSAVKDIPPPYLDSLEEKPHFQDEKPSPPPPCTSPRLQICPHQAMSFEQLNIELTAAAIWNTGKAIDALKLSPQEHPCQSHGTTKDAKTVCVSSSGFLRGFGTFSVDLSRPTPGLLLSFDWDFGSLDGIRYQVETAAELQQLLNPDRVWLCPHKLINDSDIVNAIYGFVRTKSEQEIWTRCDHCNTQTEIVTTKERNDETCRVTTKRFLGTMEKPDDPVWLAQCDR